MKRVIQDRKGFKKGHRGIKVVFREPDKGKSKSFTLHGYSLKEAVDKAWFCFHNETILDRSFSTTKIINPNEVQLGRRNKAWRGTARPSTAWQVKDFFVR